MGRYEQTIEFDETYSFERFQLNDGVPASALRRGEFSKLAGVDGRYRGALRVFPGFTDLNWGFSLASLVLLRGFEVQKGNSDTVLRGFLVLYDSGGGTYKLELKYYDGSWQTYTINSNFTGSQDDIDITVAGKIMIVTGAIAQTLTNVDIVTGSGEVVTFSGTYTGRAAIAQFRVDVDETASPDTFSAWYNQKQIITNAVITASSAVALADGISVTFASQEHVSDRQVYGVVRAVSAATILWDDDSSAFTQEPSGSLFEDYEFGFFQHQWPSGEQIPPGVLGFFSDNSSTVHTQSGPRKDLELGAQATPGTGGTAYLTAITKRYGIAWRLRDTRRNLYTALSLVPYGAIEGAAGTVMLEVEIPRDTMVMLRQQTTWDRLEVFRTIADGVSLYKEYEIDLSANSGNNTSKEVKDAFALRFYVGTEQNKLADSNTDHDLMVSGKFDVALTDAYDSNRIDTFPTLLKSQVGLNDTQLVLNLLYDFTRDGTVVIPQGLTRIGSLQGITIIQDTGLQGSPTDSVEQRTNTTLLYSPLSAFRPEMFPPQNIISIPQKDGKVQQFQEAGDFLWAGTSNALWRLQRSGSRMAANRVNVGWGISNKGAMIEANNDLFIAMRRGLVRIKSGAGTPILMAAVERKILDDWRDELSAAPDTTSPGTPPKIQTAFDAALGAVFILNTVQKECIVVWTATGQITTLEDVPWAFVTTLPDPTTGGSDRAWFAKADDSNLYRADPERAETLGPTMLPTHAKIQGAATGGSATTLVDTAQAFGTDIVGHVLYVDTGSGYEKATVTARDSTTQITFSTGLSSSGTVASGHRYILSPIRFNAVGSPLYGHSAGDQFYRRTIHGMWAQPHVISGTPNAAARWTYEVYGQNSTTSGATKDATWDSATDLPNDLPGYIPYSGSILRPGWLCVEPSVHYELLSGRIKGKVRTNDKVR